MKLLCESVCFSYSGKQWIFENYNRVFTSGITILKGYSGCGKTTLLKILAGYLSPQRGRVITPRRKVRADSLYRRKANRSSTRAPGTRNCTLENMASLTRLIVGRVTSSPGNACRFLPRAVPAITRMVMLPFSKSFCFTSFIMRPARPNVKAEYVK